MFYRNLSPSQLEAEAEKLLVNFDQELLIKTKPIDVYAVIEKCLGVPYDWKYITPDQSILGMTAFNEGRIWVFDKPDNQQQLIKCYKKLIDQGVDEKSIASLNGLIPLSIPLKKGTILIDSSLTEEGANKGRENFTVMHEVFHQVLHKDCFSQEPPNYTHCTKKASINAKKRLKTPLDYIEYQANACAAAFLMPRNLLKQKFAKYYSGITPLTANTYLAKKIIKKLAPEFNVSEQAMTYRLIHLGLLK